MKRRLGGLFTTITFILIISSSLIFGSFIKLPEPKIYGAFREVEKPIWDLGSYLKGSYQSQYDNWFSSHFPERSYFVKGYSDLIYRLFNKSPNKEVVIGNEGVLLEKSYIEAYLGLGEQKEEEYYETLVEDLKYIQDICEQNNKQFAVVITPSKAAWYPQYIPHKYFLMSKGENPIYPKFVSQLQQNQINYMDTYAYLKEIQESIPIPIFPKTGTHWNAVVGAYVTNGTIDFLNDKMKTQIPKVEIGKIQESNEPFDEKDQDIYRLMNISEKITNETYYTADTSISELQEHKKSLFWEGGSFSWQILDCLDQNQIFRNMDFIFYQQMIRQYRNNQPIDVNLDQENMKAYLDKALLHKDIIILEVNQENIRNMGYGFPHVLREYLETKGFPKTEYRSSYNVSENEQFKKGEVEALYELDGFYGAERKEDRFQRWMEKDGYITLAGSEIEKNGLKLVVDVPINYLNQAEKKAKTLQINVNGQSVANFVLLKDGKTELIIPPECLGEPKDDKYEIHLQMNTSFKMRDYEEIDDNRELSISLVSIGAVQKDELQNTNNLEADETEKKWTDDAAGIYQQEKEGGNYYHWMGKDAFFALKSSEIDEKGLLIKGNAFLNYLNVNDTEEKVLKIYVNEEKVMEYPIKESGTFEILLPKELLKQKSYHQYSVYLEMSSTFNTLKDIGIEEDRDLSIQLMYIGAPLKEEK